MLVRNRFPKVITISSVKGGVGKSTTGLSLAFEFAKKGRVLIIDMDPNNSSTSHFVDDPADIEDYNMYDVLLKKQDARACILKTVATNIDLLPSDYILEDLIIELHTKPGLMRKIYDIIQDVGEPYDYIIIDTQPSRQCLTKIAILPADLVLLPVQLDKWGVRGWHLALDMVEEYIEEERSLVIDEKQVITMLPTFYQKRVNVKQGFLDMLESRYPHYLLQSKITLSKDVPETFSMTGAKLPDGSTPQKEYAALADELDKLIIDPREGEKNGEE